MTHSDFRPADLLPQYSSQQLIQQPHVYPVDAFPEILSEAIKSLSRNVQAPAELVAGTVLSAVSLACQAFIAVRFPDGRVKPCSLYNMVLAGSGERKSAIYSLVMKPFFDFERSEKQEYEETFKEYETKMLIWKYKQTAFLKNIVKLQVQGQDSLEEEERLAEHNLTQPNKPKKMKLIYADTTPEALQRGLYDNIPAAGLMSDEASVFFAGRAKNNLGFLNQLWDGSPFDIERRSSNSFSVEGHFSMLLMIQHDLFIQYFRKHGKIASGSGFLSRFLISSVHSTQGGRNLNNSNNENSGLDVFHDRVNFFLSELKEHIRSKESSKEIFLSSSAQTCFNEFQQHTEGLIPKYKNDSTVTSFLAKAPENLMRLSALFHYFQDDKKEEIPRDTIERAKHVIRYYGNQVISLFTETVSTPEQDAEYVYKWLTDGMHKAGATFRKLNKSEIRRNIGRVRLRNNARLNAAIKILENDGRIWTEHYKNPNGSVSEVICLGQLTGSHY